MSSTRTVSLQNSAPRAGVVKGISYTIGDAPPWETVPIMDSQHSSSPRVAKAPTYTISETQQIHVPDHGPPATRQTRLPIFHQVRNMLNKSTPNTKSEEMSGNLSDSGAKAASTWENVFSTRRYSPSLKSLKTKKNLSNVSVLRDSETSSVASEQSSPASSPARSMAPSQISVNSVSQLPRGVTAKNQVKRKPVMSRSPSVSENVPPPQDLLTVPDAHPHSRFSWSTAAPSLAKRGSTDTTATGNGRPPLMSHFSWTTIGTSAAPTPMEELEDPTALPPMPSQLDQSYFSDRPNESILSRKRPVQRLDKEEWAPSTPRQRAATNSSNDSTPRATPETTPRARNFSLGEVTPKRSGLASESTTPTTTSSGKKALPLLPFMSEKQASHVEMLLTQEKNIVMQRRNIERAITDLEKVEHASPLEVSFAAVRDAKRKLEERRETLREVKMEETDIGIKIARARRREDFADGEGTLWVRRVTG